MFLKGIFDIKLCNGGKNMQIKPLLKKGLVVGIIVLFLSMSMTTMVESFTAEKHISMTGSFKESNTVMKTESRGFNITLTGTMGENGWYISRVFITFTANNGSEIMHLYYKFHDADPWTEYTGGAPIEAFEDGYYSFSALIIDQFENQWSLGPVHFKIDQIPPIFLNFTATPENLWKTKWLLNATVFDDMSGVNRVEFFVDDQFVGNISAPGPYIFEFMGKGKVVEADVYDNAGNPGICSGPPDVLKIQMFHNFFYSLILRFQMIVQWLLHLGKGD
jgi:hypothetical protein